MLKIVALCLCWAIILVSGSGNLSDITVDATSKVFAPPEPTVKPATTSPTPTTTTPPTTTVPTTTAPTTTTTAPPTTTTKPTTTTTTKPTTTSPTTTTTTTTEKPPTTTTPASTTTPAPTPVPAPKDGTWVVNGTNETCIVIRMAVQFNVTYLAKDNKTQHKLLTLPTDNSTVVTGDCGATEQMVNITWHAGIDSLNIHFVKNETTKRYSMHHVELYLGSHEFPDGASNETLKFVHEADQFPTSFANSYRCMRLQKLELTRDGENGTAGSFEVSDLQFQAFRSDKTNTFSAAQDCSTDVPDVVPIAVGCALTALVIIILAAYLIGRRRSQARGYLSM